jgi:ketosteroid isomerase-like protein
MPMKPDPTAFAQLLQRFAAAVVANDGAALGALFTPDGVYVDELFGAHQGRAAIAAMLQRFHDTGRDYRWDFIDPVINGDIGYARFRFSFASRLPECADRPVVFEGISQLRFEGALVARYTEAFDRGVALVQLGFPAERIRRIVEKAAASLTTSPEAQAHLTRFSGES